MAYGEIVSYDEIKKRYAVECTVYGKDMDLDALWWYHNKDKLTTLEKCQWLSNHAIKDWNNHKDKVEGYDVFGLDVLPETIEVSVGSIIDALRCIPESNRDENVKCALDIAEKLDVFLEKDVEPWTHKTWCQGFEGATNEWERMYGEARYSEYQLLLQEAERYRKLANDSTYNRIVHEFFSKLAEEFSDRAFKLEPKK